MPEICAVCFKTKPLCACVTSEFPLPSEPTNTPEHTHILPPRDVRFFPRTDALEGVAEKILPPRRSLEDRVGQLERQVGELLGRKFVEAEEAEHAARHARVLAAARKGLCWYAYLQDERCKLPEGHIGEHGPKHQCNVDCGLSPDGCTLPVPANQVAYWKALYWEIHGSSCPATCRGHQGG